MDRRCILQEFLKVSFKAMIIAVNSSSLNPEKYLGPVINKKLISELEGNIDLCGEKGKEVISRDSYSFLDLKLVKQNRF